MPGVGETEVQKMEQVKHNVWPGERARLAGWLMIAVNAALFAYLIVRSDFAARRASEFPWGFVLTLTLIITAPPVLVGFNILRHSPAARWIGILMTPVAVFGWGVFLFSIAPSYSGGWWYWQLNDWPTVLLVAVAFAASLFVLWALATAGASFRAPRHRAERGP
jgi:hypothetical protein